MLVACNKTPVKFTCSTCSQEDFSILCNMASLVIPALFTKICNVPNFEPHIQLTTSLHFDYSHHIDISSLHILHPRTHVSFCNFSSFTSLINTFAPSFAYTLAISFPIPVQLLLQQLFSRLKLHPYPPFLLLILYISAFSFPIPLCIKVYLCQTNFATSHKVKL